MSNKISF